MGVGHSMGRGGGIKFEGTEITGFVAEKDLKKGAICNASYKYNGNQQNINLPLPLANSSKEKTYNVFKVSDTLILIAENLKYSTSKLALIKYNQELHSFTILDTKDFPYNIKLTALSSLKYSVLSDNHPYGVKGLYRIRVVANKIDCSALLVPQFSQGDSLDKISASYFTEDYGLCVFVWSTYDSSDDVSRYSYAIGTVDWNTQTFQRIDVANTNVGAGAIIYPMDIFYPNKKIVASGHSQTKYITMEYNPTTRTCSTSVSSAPFCGVTLPSDLSLLSNINYCLSHDKNRLIFYPGGLDYYIYTKDGNTVSRTKIEIMDEAELQNSSWGGSNRGEELCTFYDGGSFFYADVIMKNVPWSASSSYYSGCMQAVIGFNKNTFLPLFNEKGKEGVIRANSAGINSTVLLFDAQTTISIFGGNGNFGALLYEKALSVTDDPSYFEQLPSNKIKTTHRQADIMVLEDIKAGQTGKAILLD